MSTSSSDGEDDYSSSFLGFSYGTGEDEVDSLSRLNVIQSRPLTKRRQHEGNSDEPYNSSYYLGPTLPTPISGRPGSRHAPTPIVLQENSGPPGPPGYLRHNHPAPYVYRGALAQHRNSHFWDSLERFESGFDQQPEKSLVSTRQPWIPNTQPPPYPHLNRLEGPTPYTTNLGGSEGFDVPPDWHRKSSDLPYYGHGMATTEAPTFDPWRQSESHPGGLNEEALSDSQLNEDVLSQTPDIAANRVDLIHDPSQVSKDMSIRLELDLEEDWEDELEEFCRLKRLGLFKKAKEHFLSKLGHVNTMPYIRVQYAEMLQSCGDFKSLQHLEFLPELPSSPTEETTDDRNRGKLVANHTLLDFLSQRPTSKYITAAWRAVRQTLRDFPTESPIGSTEVQLIVLCLRLLDHLKSCTNESIVGPAEAFVKSLFNWRQLYNDLLGESCVWDFKDLFLASVSLFGWQEAIIQFFDTTNFSRALDTIVKDWNGEPYDEASVMGLLDLLSSLILHTHDKEMKARNSLLIYHAKALADAIERNNPALMETRPFIQWLLARTVHELEAPPERPDGVRMEHFNGLQLNHSSGIQLPIYVPTQHNRKPDWDMFFFRSSPSQVRVVEIAIRAAEEIGDYALQAEAMKLLILQTQDPRQLMSALARLQLETQGDIGGYLATCLSRYLVATDPVEEESLLSDLEKPGQKGSMLCLEECENASLQWAWHIIRILLTSSLSGNSSSGTTTGNEEPSPFHGHGPDLDGSKLPPYIAKFTRVKLGINVSRQMKPLPLPDQGRKHVREDMQSNSPLRRRFVLKPPETGEALPRTNSWEDHNPLENYNSWKNYEHRENYAPWQHFEPWMNHNAWQYPSSWQHPNSWQYPKPWEYYNSKAHQNLKNDYNPWNYLDGPQPDPFAWGITPSLQVSGWPSTWYEDAHRQQSDNIRWELSTPEVTSTEDGGEYTDVAVLNKDLSQMREGRAPRVNFMIDDSAARPRDGQRKSSRTAAVSSGGSDEVQKQLSKVRLDLWEKEEQQNLDSELEWAGERRSRYLEQQPKHEGQLVSQSRGLKDNTSVVKLETISSTKGEVIVERPQQRRRPEDVTEMKTRDKAEKPNKPRFSVEIYTEDESEPECPKKDDGTYAPSEAPVESDQKPDTKSGVLEPNEAGPLSPDGGKEHNQATISTDAFMLADGIPSKEAETTTETKAPELKPETVVDRLDKADHQTKPEMHSLTPGAEHEAQSKETEAGLVPEQEKRNRTITPLTCDEPDDPWFIFGRSKKKKKKIALKDATSTSKNLIPEIADGEGLISETPRDKPDGDYSSKRGLGWEWTLKEEGRAGTRDATTTPWTFDKDTIEKSWKRAWEDPFVTISSTTIGTAGSNATGQQKRDEKLAPVGDLSTGNVVGKEGEKKEKKEKDGNTAGGSNKRKDENKRSESGRVSPETDSFSGQRALGNGDDQWVSAIMETLNAAKTQKIKSIKAEAEWPPRAPSPPPTARTRPPGMKEDVGKKEEVLPQVEVEGLRTKDGQGND